MTSLQVNLKKEVVMATAEIFEKALIYAVRKHKGQRRKGNKRPYINHVLDVLSTVNEIKGESTNIYLLCICALLHDVCEDCGVSIKKIAKKFGHHVASIVDELTINEIECELLGKTEYLKRKMLGMSSYALVIKLCDRYSNIRDMKDMPESFQRKYVTSTRVILDALMKERKLTHTHNVLISMILGAMHKYEVEFM